MRPIQPEVHESIPVRTYAEDQPEYHPISVAIMQDGPEGPYPGVYRLVTAYRPTPDEEAAILATMRKATRSYVPATMLRNMLRAIFEQHPVVLELLSGNGKLTPQNVYLGVPEWMRGAKGAEVEGG